jgi:hypothetical protein
MASSSEFSQFDAVGYMLALCFWNCSCFYRTLGYPDSILGGWFIAALEDNNEYI